jgi:hypothetical protein
MKILENIFIYTFMVIGVLLYQALRSLQAVTPSMEHGSEELPVATSPGGRETRLALG